MPSEIQATPPSRRLAEKNMKQSLCRWPVNFASRPSTSALKGEEKDLDMLLILPFV